MAISASQGALERLDRSVEIWLGAPDELGGMAGAEHLDGNERARLDRFKRDEPKVSYAAAHGLVRRVLSHYVDLPPRDWRYVFGKHGRPDIDPQTPGLTEAGRQLVFNLSHTRGLIAVAVSTCAATGVDVEWVDRTNDLGRLAEAKFAAAEQRRLGLEADESGFRARFFDYWTLKESYLKARGTGLALPLGAFAFDVEPDAPVAVVYLAAAGAWGQFGVSTQRAVPYLADWLTANYTATTWSGRSTTIHIFKCSSRMKCSATDCSMKAISLS